MTISSSDRGATVAGAGAIALWGALALFAAMTGPIPPFQVTAITFAIAGLVGLAIAVARGRVAALKPTPASFALGLFGFFAYHACYFAAVKLAPPAEAQLIASLWALFIVLFSALLPGHRLERRHVIGAAIGLAAATLLVWPKLGAGGGAGVWLGYALAAACALIWSSYSVLSRLVAEVPTESLSLTCLATAALAVPFHLMFETAVWPTGARRARPRASRRGVLPVGRRDEARQRLAARRALLRRAGDCDRPAGARRLRDG